MKETIYDKYKLKRLANGQNYLSEEEFYHRLDTDDRFAKDMINMRVVPHNYLDGRGLAQQKLEPLNDVDETKGEKNMKLLIAPIQLQCKECNETKEETEFANRRGGKKSKVCKTCMGRRISDGHAKNHFTTQKQLDADLSSPRCEVTKTSTPIPLLKERPTIKAISEETLHSMLMMAYKRGYDQGVNAIETMNHDDAIAFVERSCGGIPYE